jgi:hypothetical protein
MLVHASQAAQAMTLLFSFPSRVRWEFEIFLASLLRGIYAVYTYIHSIYSVNIDDPELLNA